jgi:predicted kinase
MDRAPLVLVTGPAGAGKTTAARAWARLQPVPTAHLSLDRVRDLVIKGYANPEDGWTDVAQTQYDLARTICVDAATRYLAAGYRCVVDDAIFPDWPRVSYDRWRADLGGLPHVVVVLMPSAAILVQRNARRTGRVRLREETLNAILAMMEPWRRGPFPVIDNSQLTPARTARVMTAVIEDWCARPPGDAVRGTSPARPAPRSSA